MPKRSTSLLLLSFPEEPSPPRAGLIGVGLAISSLFFALAAAAAASSAAARSASSSYPSFLMRSSSSLALRSAASKSRASPPGVIFLAPSPFFFAPKMLALRGAPVTVPVLRMAAAGTARGAAGLLSSDPAARGDLGREPLPLAGALRKGEPLREPEAGVPVREGGLLGRLMVGLSQDEKKSSSSLTGVLEPEVSGSGTSVMTTSLGYLAMLEMRRRGEF